MPEVSNVSVPYRADIRDGLPNGAQTEITGEVLNGGQKAIWIEFKRGYDIALHLQVRLGIGGRNEIVVNACENDRWGSEDDYRQSVTIGGSVYVRILVRDNKYDISVNGRDFSFKHRIPVQSITSFEVKGDIRVETINFSNYGDHIALGYQPGGGYPPYQPGFPSQPGAYIPPAYPTPPVQPSYNPGYVPSPYNPNPGFQQPGEGAPIGTGATLSYQSGFGGDIGSGAQINQPGGIGYGAQLNQPDGIGFGAQLNSEPNNDPRGYYN